MVIGRHSLKNVLLAALACGATMGLSSAARADEQPSSPAPQPAAEAPKAEAAPLPKAEAAPAEAPAEAPAPPSGPYPRASHTALYTAIPGEPLVIVAGFEHPELIKRAVVVYTPASGTEQVAVFQRGGESTYVATIPADAVKPPGLTYAIELEHLNGTKIASFASRLSPHPVAVVEDRTDARERAALARLGGRRSVLSVGGEYVGFGNNTLDYSIQCGANQKECQEGSMYAPTIQEHFYRLDASYTYRSLRTVSEFGFRLGVIRGRSLKPQPIYESSRYDVGLNFGAARIRFRLLDAWQVEGELLTSITEDGFSSGIGASTLIGDPYGNKIVLGFESLGIGGAPFGNRFFSRIDIVAGDRVILSPIIEASDMPNSGKYGVRLLGDVGIRITGGFSVQLRAGYQARKATSGGPGFGANVSYAF